MDDPYGVLRTAVLTVMFTQLIADASNPNSTQQHAAPISTLAVCEMAMMLHESPESARPGAVLLTLPDELGGTDDAAGGVLLVLLIIDAALRAQTYTKHRSLFLLLIRSIVLAALPFASTALVDDSTIPAGLRGSIGAVINDFQLGHSDDMCRDLKRRVGHLKGALMSFVTEPQQTKRLSAISATLERGVPLLSAVMQDDPGPARLGTSF
jgi:hypothetical protein